jgi:hypothetical protein
MATKMGYAPGVRIQLKDNSAYTVVQNPNTVAGIVGYASKGELNKIINVANTGELGVKLGYGYQSYKYNQGMYAANAVLTTGGEVEFVRPYGEEISRTDAYKRDLKTDAFVVAFDKNASLYRNGDESCWAKDRKTGEALPETSFKVKHFASTRFKTDGAAEFGVTRKINNIAETIESNNNVSFGVDASENYSDSQEARLFDNKHCTDMVLFAIMNRDPSYANRAYDRYEVVSATRVSGSPTQIECVLNAKPMFVIGDTVLLPATSQKVDQYGQKGTSYAAVDADVLDIDDKKVLLDVKGSYGTSLPNVIIYNDSANAIADGFDYLNIKTAVAGNTVKNCSTIKLGDLVSNKKPNVVVNCGSTVELVDRENSGYIIRFDGGNNAFGTDGTYAVSDSDNTMTVYLTATGAMDCVEVGDELSVTIGGIDYPFTVKWIEGNSIIGDIPENVPVDPNTNIWSKITFVKMVEGDNVYIADISAINGLDTSKNTWAYVASVISDTIRYAKGYSKVPVTNDIISGNGTRIVVDPSAVYDYAVGDLVGIVRDSNTIDYAHRIALMAEASTPVFDGTVYTVASLNPMSGEIILTSPLKSNINIDPQPSETTPIMALKYQLINFSTTNSTIYNVATTYPCDSTIVSSKLVDGVHVPSGETQSYFEADFADELRVGSVLTVTIDGQETTPHVSAINGNKVYFDTVENMVDGGSYTFDYYAVTDYEFCDICVVSGYSIYVSKSDQKVNQFADFDGKAYVVENGSSFNPTVDKSPTVLADSDIGATFMALGLAKSQYLDINYDGNPMQVFTLTDEGIAVARMYLAVSYRFNGKLYEFDGTIAPYNYNNRQLSIKESADYELVDSGLEFVLNDSGVLDYFLENNSYDLSQTVQNGNLNGSYTAIAYNPDDPAIINDAVWTYDPQNNNGGSTLSTVWNLFVNKDASDVDMLVAAGMAINAPFTRKNETLNPQVMQAMINVCEARKDCFCVFDGVYEPDIQKAVKKMISAGQLSLGRWGAIYDGRGVFQDSLYTNSQVDVMKSVQLAAIITANRSSGIFWIPPAGDEAYVPAAWGTKERFTRSYNSEDKNCDHAKLSDIHVNATRVNKDGIRIWGDFTCQMEDTAFNQIHVTMLVAGIHKMFYKYLDHKVFKLNTTVLRAQITSDLQDKLNAIKRQNPPGLIEGKVICDDTNNTPEIIDQNFLIVDLKLLPPKSTRWIILRTTVESQKNGKTISTEVIE